MRSPTGGVKRIGIRVSLSEVLAALSHALDLTDGAPLGHTVRSCIIGMRLGGELGLADEERTALYYALLLKDAGCSSNAARMSVLFGSDDRLAKPRMKMVDWERPISRALGGLRSVAVGRPLRERLARLTRLAANRGAAREVVQIRCERGAEIARHLGFPEATAEAIRLLDEHWNGRGHPEGRRGEEIPLLARVVSLAQNTEAFHAEHGLEAAIRVARQRRGRWFDPRLVDILAGWGRDRAWWDALRSPDVTEAAIALEPAYDVRTVDDAGLDEVARAFAEIIDAKSPFTFRHSANVAGYADAIAAELGIAGDERRRIRRAALLHDIGKLGVSNQILDKPGRLTPDERAAVERHPLYSWEILSRVTAFADFARTAALHHEKLDGTGYPWHLTGDALDTPARILCVADIYEALTADRPYRAGMSPSDALELIARDRATRLCARSTDALAALVHRRSADGLTRAAG